MNTFQRENARLITILVIVVLVGAGLFVMHGAAAVIENETTHGQDWIDCRWYGNEGEQVFRVTFDGVTAENVTANHVFINGLDPGTKHHLEVANGTSYFEKDVTTDPLFWMSPFFVWFVVLVACLVLSTRVPFFAYVALFPAAFLLIDSLLLTNYLQILMGGVINVAAWVRAAGVTR